MNQKITAVNDSTNVGFGGLAKSICQTIEGTTTDSRTGRDIIVTRIEVNWRSTVNAASATLFEQPRVMILYDLHANGVAATNQEILETAGAAVTGESMRFINFGNISRFVVLYDRLWVLPAYTITAGQYQETGAGATDTEQYVGRFDMNVELPVTYANGATMPSTGNILFFVSGSTFARGAGTSKWNIEYYARVTFADN